MKEPTLSYDAATRRATIEFPNGHKLGIRNIDEDKAKVFFDKHAKEFEKRNCVLQTSGCFEVRSHG